MSDSSTLLAQHEHFMTAKYRGIQQRRPFNPATIKAMLALAQRPATPGSHALGIEISTTLAPLVKDLTYRPAHYARREARMKSAIVKSGMGVNNAC